MWWTDFKNKGEGWKMQGKIKEEQDAMQRQELGK